jgi:alpha-L-fucosidase
MTAFHHAENWWFFPHWRNEFDTSDPRYAGLYGEAHDVEGVPPAQPWSADWWQQERPSQAFLSRWRGKIDEVIERFRPDMMWFDFGLQFIQEQVKLEMLAHYYNQALQSGQDVVVTYKWNHLVPGAGVIDLELGRFDTLTYMDWITDTTVDAGQGWGYLQDTAYKTPESLIHYLIDNVSKNGYLLLNVGPKPDGTIPTQAQDVLREIGRWLAVNGEAIYGTTPWMVYGEGPTEMAKGGPFMEDAEVSYTGQDIRFTTRENVLYAICLGWPGESLLIKTASRLYPTEIQSVRMLGVEHNLEWSLTPDGLRICCPAEKPCEHAYAFKIQRKPAF